MKTTIEVQNLKCGGCVLKKLGYPAVDDKNSLMAKANSFVSYATGKI